MPRPELEVYVVNSMVGWFHALDIGTFVSVCLFEYADLSITYYIGVPRTHFSFLKKLMSLTRYGAYSAGAGLASYAGNAIGRAAGNYLKRKAKDAAYSAIKRLKGTKWSSGRRRKVPGKFRASQLKKKSQVSFKRMSDIDNGTMSSFWFKHRPQKLFKTFKLASRLTF